MLRRIVLAPVDLLIMCYGWLVYLFTNKTPKSAYLAMVRLFCVSKGYSSEFFHSLVTIFRSPYKMELKLSGITGTFEKDDIDAIVNRLNEDGYYVFEKRIPEDMVDRLMEFAKNTNANIRPYNSDGSDTVLTRKKAAFNRENPEAIRYDWHANDLLKSPDVQKLISDEVILAISQGYLKCKPIVDGVRMWWNTSFSKEPNSEAATMHHFDMERLKWFKVFVYLTDVELNNGPHVFVRGSHKTGVLPYDLLKRGYFMVTDDVIFKHFDKKDEVIYTAPRGTMIIEDTKGMHKGMPVLEGDRLIFQMQFSDCMFGLSSDASFPPEITDILRMAMKKYPEVYEYYKA